MYSVHRRRSDQLPDVWDFIRAGVPGWREAEIERGDITRRINADRPASIVCRYEPGRGEEKDEDVLDTGCDGTVGSA